MLLEFPNIWIFLLLSPFPTPQSPEPRLSGLSNTHGGSIPGPCSQSSCQESSVMKNLGGRNSLQRGCEQPDREAKLPCKEGRRWDGQHHTGWLNLECAKKEIQWKGKMTKQHVLWRTQSCLTLLDFISVPQRRDQQEPWSSS